MTTGKRIRDRARQIYLPIFFPYPRWVRRQARRILPLFLTFILLILSGCHSVPMSLSTKSNICRLTWGQRMKLELLAPTLLCG
jgi:hypothetical protein